MRTTSQALFALVSLTSIALSACSPGDSFIAPDGTVPGLGGTGGTGGSGGTGGTGTSGTGTSGTGGGNTAGADTTFPGGFPGGSTDGGQTETEQGFLGWKLEVLPSGELQLRFKQTNLSVASFTYVVGGSVEGFLQCYNKADNAPQGTPFSRTLSASATLGATSLDGTIHVTLSTSVLADQCGNTQFTARPVTTSTPWTWTGVYLDNPAGRLALPDISLGDAPVGFSVP
jgi:hypothetical protein